MDSDVIAHNYKRDWNWDEEEKYDMIFYERWWNGEIVAGGYGVKNFKKTRKFLRMWADLEYSQPKGFSSADNGAIHVALMKWFQGVKNDSKASQCIKDYQELKEDVMNLKPYNKFVNCARTALGLG